MATSLSKVCRLSIMLILSVLIAFVLFSPHLLASNKLVLAIDKSPPYSFEENGKPKGLLIEFAQKFAQEAKLDLEVLFCPWARCLQLAKVGRADILLGLTKSLQRKQDYLFVKPSLFVTKQPFAFYYVKPEMEVQNPRDLEHRLIGTTRGSIYYPDFDHNSKLQKIELNDISVQIKMLKQGRIDTFIYVSGVVEPYLKQYDLEGEVKVSSYQAHNEIHGYLVLSKNSPFSPEVISNTMPKLDEMKFMQTLFGNYGIKY